MRPKSLSSTLILRRSRARMVPSSIGNSYAFPVRLSVIVRLFFEAIDVTLRRAARGDSSPLPFRRGRAAGGLLRMPLMNPKRHLLETLTLVAAAILCALVSNALAGRERKLALVGNYPNALKVPKEETEKKDKTGDSFASHSGPTALSSPADPGAATPSEVASKVNGTSAAAAAP